VVRSRPGAERRLGAGYQRHVDEQAARYAAQLAHAAQLAARFECGQVVGVFTAQVGGDIRRRAYLVGLLPVAAVPILIAGAAAGIPGMVPLLGALPFITGAWFGLSLWRAREPRRRVWCYAFTAGFLLLDDQHAAAVPVLWSQVIDVSEVWTQVYNVSAEESRPALTGYRLHTADGQAHEITRSFQNVRDPYGVVGQMFRNMLAGPAGQAIPAFPVIDEIIARYAVRPGPRA